MLKGCGLQAPEDYLYSDPTFLVKLCQRPPLKKNPSGLQKKFRCICHGRMKRIMTDTLLQTGMGSHEARCSQGFVLDTSEHFLGSSILSLEGRSVGFSSMSGLKVQGLGVLCWQKSCIEYGEVLHVESKHLQRLPVCMLQQLHPVFF